MFQNGKCAILGAERYTVSKGTQSLWREYEGRALITAKRKRACKRYYIEK